MSKRRQKVHCPGCGKACKSFGMMAIADIPGRGRVIYTLCNRCTVIMATGSEDDKATLLTDVELRLGPGGGIA